MDHPIKERIQGILSERKISVNHLSKLIGMEQRTLNNQINGKGEPSIKTLIALSNYFGVSIDWMVYGNGEKYRKKEEYVLDENQTSHSDDQNPYYTRKQTTSSGTKPLIPHTIDAGQISSVLDNIHISINYEQLPVIPYFPKYDFTIQVKGDSMEPEFRRGDEIACLRIKESQFIQWGRTHLLDTPQGVLIKRIYDDGKYIVCKSEYSEKYPDFRIQKSDIFSIHLVVGLLRM